MTEPFDRPGIPAAPPDPTQPYPVPPDLATARSATDLNLTVDDLDDELTDEEIDPSAAAAARRARRARGLLDWVVVVGVALLVAFLVRTFVLAHFVVDGTSMSTTLHNGDRVFVNKLSYRLHDPRRGDVVVLHEDQPGFENRDLIKRVIALPGEEIAMRDCIVTIDGVPLDEPYLDPVEVPPGDCGEPIEPTVVPEGSVFVMGDNRDESQDSRALGAIDEDDIVGRAFVVFWPTSHWRWL
jgi:signal peptidase I